MSLSFEEARERYVPLLEAELGRAAAGARGAEPLASDGARGAEPLASDGARGAEPLASDGARGAEPLASGDQEELLARMIRYHLETGGKRLRALIPVWIASNLGADGEEVVPIGCGTELLHNATLVHDDYQDGDTHRRGRETIWQRWSGPQAINAGDALYFLGVSSLARGPGGASLVEPASRAMVRVIDGQVTEFRMQSLGTEPEALPPTPETWERMARGKTGALFGLCFRAGAVAGGADAATVEAASRYGETLGMLFQVQDDYLDLVGDKGRDRRGTDLAEGKISFPVAWAHGNADPRSLERLRVVIDTPRAETSDARIDEGLELLQSTGALEATAAWLRRMRDELEADETARLAPGLAERFLEPVAHAL